MIRKRGTLALILGLFSISSQGISAQSGSPVALAQISLQEQVIVDYLNQKTYQADKTALTAKDLEISPELDPSLQIAGLSFYTLLRNESFARHGYVFKDMVLHRIFSHVTWYKEKPDFQFSQLSKLENKNVEFIKSLENTYDYDNIAKAIDGLPDSSSGLYSDRNAVFHHSVKMSLNHLHLNPSRLLRNLIFFKQGYVFKEPLLQEIFSRMHWHRDDSSASLDMGQVIAKMDKMELIDVELLKKKEWLEILNSVNFTLPKDVFSVPVIGYNTIFIRQFNHGGQSTFFSSQFLHAVSDFDTSLLDDHRTDVEKLVDPEIVSRIKAEKDPAKKLGLFFENKKYAGYADTLVFNHSDMETPSYLKDAVKAYGVNYLILLRKEIHARVGARFADKKSGAIFKQCSWFKPRYDITTLTVSRFSEKAKITRNEIINFSLLEGEELGPRALSHKDENMVVDINGNSYFIKVGKVSLPGFQKTVEIGSDFPSLEAYKAGSLQAVVDQIFTKYKFDWNTYLDKEVAYSGRGM